MSVKTAAMISDGVVVNACVYDEDTSAAWLAAVASDYDEVRIVDKAGVGWTVESDGLRPPQPYPSWTWNGEYYVPPVPRPQGVNYKWDEEGQEWVYTGPPQPTIIQD